MFLTSQQIRELVSSGDFSINPFTLENLKDASYTFTMGKKARILKSIDEVDSRTDPEFEDIEITEQGYELKPGEFIILTTNETVSLKGRYVCLLSTRAPIAHMGLDVTQGSFWCEPNTDGFFALETTNRGSLPVRLFPGIKIAKGAFSPVGA